MARRKDKEEDLCLQREHFAKALQRP